MISGRDRKLQSQQDTHVRINPDPYALFIEYDQVRDWSGFEYRQTRGDNIYGRSSKDFIVANGDKHAITNFFQLGPGNMSQDLMCLHQ